MYGPAYNRGLSSYPGEPCYDPNRSPWFPNWLPNPNELACNAAVAKDAASCLLFPWTETCASGASKVGGAILQNVGAGITAIGTAANPGSDTTAAPKCVGFQTFNPDSGQCEFDPSAPSFMILAALAVGALFLVRH